MWRVLRIIVLVTILMLTNVSAVKGEALLDGTFITGVIGHAQGYRLSCESRSAADWAAFWGVSISESEFLQALPRADDPDVGFVGDPYDYWGSIPPGGYGVHADPVAATLREFGLVAEAYHHSGWEDLRKEIDVGHPVIVWVIGQMWDGTPVEYKAPDGNLTTVAKFEHTMILVGYNSDIVQVVDAYSGQYQNYRLETFLNSWAVLGNMAIFGSNEPSQTDEPQAESQAETYIVQPGDFLEALADKFGTTWQALADLNSIGDPYTIYPGQVLQLPGDGLFLVETDEQAAGISRAEFRVHLPIVQRVHTDQFELSIESYPALAAIANTGDSLP